MRDLKEETSLFVGILVFMNSSNFMLVELSMEKVYTCNLGASYLLINLQLV